ncbi:MAG: hypothetical protein JSC189_000667 [Candidatus Tokpelaia sp. JSC189]|nr:MAG: hypothetical protein JSC189_000667 [Candidatus Tokpelaia sp. JSC189]
MSMVISCVIRLWNQAQPASPCIKEGKHFIGIEWNENFFDLAVSRIRTAYNQLDMFLNLPKCDVRFGGAQPQEMLL